MLKNLGECHYVCELLSRGSGKHTKRMTKMVTGTEGGEQEGGQIGESEQMWLMLATGQPGRRVYGFCIIFKKKGTWVA